MKYEIISKKNMINNGNSRSVGNLSLIKATVVMNLHVYSRYKANFIGGFFEIGIMTFSMFLFSNVINFRDESVFAGEVGENALFIFFTAGMLMMFFQNSALFVPVNSVRRDLYNGTLEFIYSGPQSRYAYLVGNILADLLIRQIFMFPMFILLISLTGWSINIIYMLLLLLLFFALVASVGIMVSLMAISWKQVGNLVGIFGMLIQFIGGVFLPVQGFPLFLQWFAYILPFTFAFDLMRYYAFGGAWITLIPVTYEWIMIAAYAVTYFLISRYLLRKVERYAKKSGLHII